MRSQVSLSHRCRAGGASCAASGDGLLRSKSPAHASATSAAHGFDFTRVPATSTAPHVDHEKDSAKEGSGDRPKAPNTDAPKDVPKDAKKDAPKDAPKDAGKDAKDPPKAVEKGPCGRASLASSVGPSDKRLNGQAVTATVDPEDFGNTSKLGADFRFGACKVGNEWRFHLDALVVPVVSKVQDATFRQNVASATDAIVTKTSYSDIVRDLTPTRTGTFSVSCGSESFKDKVTTYSRRKTYWNHQFVVDHEAFHRKNWIEMYRTELVKAESDIWAATLPAADAPDAAAAVAKANTTLTKHMTDAYGRVCKAYGEKKESRAYDDGAPAYQKLVDEISARAKKEGW